MKRRTATDRMRQLEPMTWSGVWQDPERIVSLGWEDLIDFMKEPKRVFNGLSLKEICRDESCGIIEVHRKHKLAAVVACPECLGMGIEDYDGPVTKCALCLGKAVLPRSRVRALRLVDRKRR